MKNLKTWMHRLSFAQYPLLAVAVFFCYRPFFRDFEMMLQDVNLGLVFFGLAISFTTLQDTTKTHYSLAKRLFSNPFWSNVLIWTIAGEVIFFFAAGLTGLFLSSSEALNELAYGILMLALGLVGMLKSAVEMAEFHQRKPVEMEVPEIKTEAVKASVS